MKKTIFCALLSLLTGCANFQGLFGDNVVTEKLNLSRPAERYSENPQLNVPANRQYKHMTKQRMEEDAELHSQAGSMWVSEGQGSYLFVQNKSRREGDAMNVKLEGAALRQVETKVGVIKKLLKQLEDQEQEAQNRLAANGENGDRAPAAVKAAEPKKEKDEKEDLSDVQNISTRIVEKMADGNYRVKGMQPFMIGKREFKVIVTGLIRPEDYNDEGIPSSKLLDPQFDVVSVRRKQPHEAENVL